MANKIGFIAPVLTAAFLTGSALAGVPGISGINGSADLRFDVDGFRDGINASDQGEASLNVNAGDDPLPGGLFWSDTSVVEVDLGPTAGRIRSEAMFAASDQTFSYSQLVSGSGSVAEGDQFAGNYDGMANFFVNFDEPTLVDIVIRLTATGPFVGDGTHASVQVSGIGGQGPITLEFTDGNPAGVQEFTIRTTIDSPRALIFDFDANLDLNPDQGFPTEIGEIILFGSVSVVPGSGSLALLGACGLLAARRRR